MDIFAGQIAPVVYLNGTILFVAGVAIVRVHNFWVWRWPLALTLTGWAAVCGGLYRMIAPAASQAGPAAPTYLGLAGIVAIGAFLTFKAYGPERQLQKEL